MWNKALRAFPNVLILRIRFPIAADLDPKNHLTKILGYHRLVDVPNVSLSGLNGIGRWFF